MALFWLINSVLVSNVRKLPGDSVNDAIDNVSNIRAAGGLLWPQGNATIDAAAANAASARVNRGANEIELESIMQAAVDAVQLASDDVSDRLIRAVNARNLVVTNVSLAAYPVAAVLGINEGVLNVQNDVILLIGQTVPAENGLYVVGVVSGGLAPLTRSGLLPVGYVFDENSIAFKIAEGSTGLGTFINAAAGIVGTNDIAARFQYCRKRNTVDVKIRCAFNGNVPNLAAYVVAADPARNDNVAVNEGEEVVLIAQTTPAENGIYRLGAISGGLAPLTRTSDMPVGTILGSQVGIRYNLIVFSGDVFARSRFFDTAAPGSVVGTTNPGFVPEVVTQPVVLVNGAATLTNVPVVSATKTAVVITRTSPVGTTLTVEYALTGNPTAGALGTASIPIMATLADGTINVADGSTIRVSVINR